MFDKVVAAGADVTQEPREQSYCTDFAIRDPFGKAMRIGRDRSLTDPCADAHKPSVLHVRLRDVDGADPVSATPAGSGVRWDAAGSVACHGPCGDAAASEVQHRLNVQDA